MKKLIIIAFLIASCTAGSPWTKVPLLGDEHYYIDLTTILKNGNLRKVWELSDLKKPNEDGAKSERIRMEYDCYGERGKVLAIEHYSENMGKGKVIRTINCVENKTCWWDNISPNTVGAVKLDHICKD
jgi:hypothetical protein